MALTYTPRALNLQPTTEYEFYKIMDLKDGINVGQAEDQLCWAACVESAWASNGQHRSQADLAQAHIAGCEPENEWDLGEYCNQARTGAAEMLSVWRQERFEHTEYSVIDSGVGRLLEHEICRDRPVQAWVGDGFHGVMIYGYRRKPNGQESVYIMDPAVASMDWQSPGSHLGWIGTWHRLQFDSPPSGLLGWFRGIFGRNRSIDHARI